MDAGVSACVHKGSGSRRKHLWRSRQTGLRRTEPGAATQCRRAEFRGIAGLHHVFSPSYKTAQYARARPRMRVGLPRLCERPCSRSLMSATMLPQIYLRGYAAAVTAGCFISSFKSTGTGLVRMSRTGQCPLTAARNCCSCSSLALDSICTVPRIAS